MSAIINWREAPDSEIVCYCNGVTKGEIVAVLEDNPNCRKLQCIKDKTGAGTGSQCEEVNPRGRCCIIDIQKIIFIQSGELAPPKECCGSGCCG